MFFIGRLSFLKDSFGFECNISLIYRRYCLRLHEALLQVEDFQGGQKNPSRGSCVSEDITTDPLFIEER